jgi:RNA-binding protein
MATLPATSPKKRSLMPSGELRRKLRAHGHALSPLVQVGKAGVTGGLVKQVEQALFDHELIKIKIAAESPSDRFAVAERLATVPGVSIVQILGRVILAYKRHPKIPKFEGKRAKEGTEAAVAPKASKRRRPEGRGARR